jgi:hypothetical protein
MNKTVELKCWTCEEPFPVQVGSGRPRRYCNASCKALARKVARRVRYVEQAEFRRMAHIAPF